MDIQPTQPQNIHEFFQLAWPIIEQNLDKSEFNLTKQTKNNFIKLLDTKHHINYGLGAMFGAFIGDSLGSYLQFQTKIKQNYADQAMRMPGGGRAFPFLLPGMLTDDSQLASHMLRALIDYDPSKTLRSQEKYLLFSIADQYKQWYNSPPFDIGHTTRSALSLINNAFQPVSETQDLNKQIFFDCQIRLALQKIAEKNKSSESNGSLMRITPMAFFISLVLQNPQTLENGFQDFDSLIQNEINMTHGSQAIFQTSKAYVHLLVDLICRNDKSLKQVYRNFQTNYTSEQKKTQKSSKNHVQEWINDSKFKPPSSIVSIGWAKIAFTQTLIKLSKLIEKQQKKQNFMNPEMYKDLIRSVLILGGDTDTNSAIVGGLIGSIVGFKNLPSDYLMKQFKVRMGQIKKSKDWLCKRNQYEPRRIFLNAIKLVQQNVSEMSQTQQ